MCNDFGDAQNNLLGRDSTILKKEPKWDAGARCTVSALNVCEF